MGLPNLSSINPYRAITVLLYGLLYISKRTKNICEHLLSLSNNWVADVNFKSTIIDHLCFLFTQGQNQIQVQIADAEIKT